MRERYQMIDVMYIENIFHTKMMLKEFNSITIFWYGKKNKFEKEKLSKG